MAAAPAPAEAPDLIRRLEAELRALRPQLRKVASHLVHERGLPPHQGIAELAESAGTAPATVLRLARRIGFQGFGEFKLACGPRALPSHVAAEAIATMPPPSAGVGQRALDEFALTIGALRPLVDHPLFAQAARWMHEAEVVWVAGSMPGDAVAADCIVDGLRRHGIAARSGWMTRMAMDACALGDRSVQMQVALSSAIRRPSDFLPPTMEHECRRIVLSRSPSPCACLAANCLVLALDITIADQVLPATAGLLAAWGGFLRAPPGEHPS